MLLNRLFGAHCYIIPYESLDGGLTARYNKLADTLRYIHLDNLICFLLTCLLHTFTTSWL